MKRLSLFVFIIAVLLILSGCNGAHTHKWTEANFQNPSTCEECGATRGLPLTADFERMNITDMMEINKEYSLKTLCAEENIETAVKIKVMSCTTIASDDAHEARSGYQWIIIKLTITGGDEASNAYGFTYNCISADYYDAEKYETSFQYSDKKNNTFTVNYNGKDYADCICNMQKSSTEWTLNHSDDIYYKTITVTWSFLVPEGYDGIVVGVHSSAINNEGKLFKDYYSSDGFLLFRAEGR